MKSFPRQISSRWQSNLQTSAELELNDYKIQSVCHPYPRHIPVPHSRSNHYNLHSQDRNTGDRPTRQAATEDSAYSILQYQLLDCKVKQVHLANLKRNLKRRLQAAKMKGNDSLVALLTAELDQLNNERIDCCIK